MLGVANRITILLLVVAALWPASMAFAEIGVWASNSNNYMMVQMGRTFHADLAHPPPIVHVDRPGRWAIWSLVGDPEVNEDDGFALIRTAPDTGPCDRLGYTTIRVGSADGGVEDVIFGDGQDGGWILEPYPSSGEVGNYLGYPIDSFHSGCYVNSQYRISEGNIFVQFRMAIIRDQVRMEVHLRNDDAEAHTVGLRHCADSRTDAMDSVSYPFIPGKGIIMAEQSLTGTAIPPYFELLSDRTHPRIGMRCTLDQEDATRPDRVAIGDWMRFRDSDWDYTPIPDRMFVDYGFALWWDPVLLNAGESRTIVTYIGMAAASSNWTSVSGSQGSVVRQDPFCVAVQGPRSLPIYYDPNQSAESMLQSNPFNIKAYVYNMFDKTWLTNVNANLTLPPGLKLVSGDATQLVSTIAPETEGGPITWEVKSDGTVSGELKYSVSFSGAPVFQKTVTRSIILPATNTTNLQQGWQMISVPFKFNNSQIEEAMNLGADTYNAFMWDTQTREYKPATSIGPGKAFWLKSNIDRPSNTLARDAVPMAGTDSYRIVLYTGWNQFGNPYLYPINWGRVKVLYTAQDSTVSIEDAANRNWIRRTIHWWDADAREYVSSSDPLTNLLPWQGYWLKAMVPCQLIIPPVEQPNGDILGVTARSSKAAPATTNTTDGWKLNIVAQAGSAVDKRSMLGVSSRASDSYDTADLEQPPSPGGYVAISFPHNDWGANNDNYMTDIRRSTNQSQTWDFEVRTDQNDTDIVLTWPNVVEVPKNYRLKLVDVDGNVTKYVRTTSSYRYNSGDGTVRRFKLVAEPNSSNKLMVTGLAVSPSRAVGGATISYNLSEEAVSDIVIKNTSGRIVKTLAKGRGVTRGINSLSWNYRNEAGNAVPAGSYLVEVVATTPEGEIVKSVRPFLVAR